MGDAARPGRRGAVSLAACLLIGAAAAASDAGCGVSLLGTGPLADGGHDTSSSDGGGGADGAIVVDGSMTQSTACASDRTMCTDKCTDTTADPDNCGVCGKKCDLGQTCNASQCEILCVGGTLACDGVCIDPKSDSTHCGQCTTACSAPTPLCLEGTCNMDCNTKKLCPPLGTDAGSVAPYCADTMTDRNNCGDCMVKCNANEACLTGMCKPVCGTGATIVETFGPTMYGCSRANVTFGNRNTLCSAPYTICSPAKWKAQHGTTAPKFNYWTNEELDYIGRDQNCSAVSFGSGNYCGGSPMRVCGARTDPTGNQCNWTNCGLGGTASNQFFGGCVNELYAGGLCCAP